MAHSSSWSQSAFQAVNMRLAVFRCMCQSLEVRDSYTMLHLFCVVVDRTLIFFGETLGDHPHFHPFPCWKRRKIETYWNHKIEPRRKWGSSPSQLDWYHESRISKSQLAQYLGRLGLLSCEVVLICTEIAPRLKDTMRNTTSIHTWNNASEPRVWSFDQVMVDRLRPEVLFNLHGRTRHCLNSLSHFVRGLR